MSRLGSRQDCFPAKPLHPTQGMWLHGMLGHVDIDGSIETTRGFRDGSVADERKVDQVLSELDICMEWW